MPTLASGELDVSYLDEGAGSPIVWIPGTGLLGRTWAAQVQYFRPRYRCLSVDLRASGATVGGARPFSVGDLGQDVAGWLDRLDVGPATLVGLSLGSAVAQEVALLRPDLVERLVLVSTWSSTSREHHIRRHFQSRLFALENGPLDVYAQFAFWMSSPWLFDHEPDRQSMVEATLRTQMSPDFAGTAEHFRADLTHETQDRLGQIGCPTQVIYGADDLITLPWYNQRVASLIPAARSVEIARAGHLMWLERPDELNGAIDRFLHDTAAGVPPPAPAT